MFKVIKRFKDLKDDNYIYEVGAEFPRKGAKASEERIKELSSKNNKQGQPLIVEVKEEKVEIENKEVDLEIAPEINEEPIEEPVKVKKPRKRKK